MLAQAKELNLPFRNAMPREDLQKTIKGATARHKKITFSVDTCICTESLNEVHTQQVINEKKIEKKNT